MTKIRHHSIWTKYGPELYNAVRQEREILLALARNGKDTVDDFERFMYIDDLLRTIDMETDK